MDDVVKIPRVRRKKTSIYVDEQLWADFVAWCRARRTSTCHLIEPYLYAILQGSARAAPFAPLPKIDLTLNVSREVLRARRRERVSDFPVWNERGSFLRCSVCGRPSRWVVYYHPGWDKAFRIYVCGFHVRPYRRMTSLEKGYPKVAFDRLYRSAEEK